MRYCEYNRISVDFAVFSINQPTKVAVLENRILVWHWFHSTAMVLSRIKPEHLSGTEYHYWLESSKGLV